MEASIDNTKFISEPPVEITRPYQLTGSYPLRKTLAISCQNVENMEELYQVGVQSVDFNDFAITKFTEGYNVTYEEEKIQRGRFLVLKDKFAREVDRKNFDVNAQITEMFNTIAIQLSKIDFKNTDVEITPSNAIKFIFKFSNGKMLMTSKRISDTDDAMVFSYFVNGELILSDAASISELTDGIKQYLTV